MIEAYEEQEDQQASELQQLHYKLNTSLMHTSTSSGVNSADIDFTTQGTSSAHLQVQPACCNNSSSKQVVILRINVANKIVLGCASRLYAATKAASNTWHMSVYSPSTNSGLIFVSLRSPENTRKYKKNKPETNHLY